MLRVSDYNTTGLTGSKDEVGGNWYSLINSTGQSSKPGSAGGSYGIGKSAPLACSALRTVLYSTHDHHGVRAFQGIARLSTHEMSGGRRTRSTGFLGDENGPVFEEEIPSYFRKEQVGTDICIPGLLNLTDNLEEEFIKVVLRDFYYAIEKDNLVVKVGGTLINSLTLEQLMEEYMSINNQATAEDLTTYFGYLALTNKGEASQFVEKAISYKGKDYGSIKVFVYIDPKGTKQLCMLRKTGMRIYYRVSRKLIPLSGLVVAEGEDLNRVLRMMEPPTHDSWNPNIAESIKQEASGVKTKMETAIRQAIDEVTSNVVGEEIEMVGMGEFLPDITQPNDEKKKVEQEKGKPLNFQFKSNVRQRELPEYIDEVAAGEETEKEVDGKSSNSGKGKKEPESEPEPRDTDNPIDKKQKRVRPEGPFQGRKRTKDQLEITDRSYVVKNKPNCYRIIIRSNRSATVNLTLTMEADQIKEKVHIVGVTPASSQNEMHLGRIKKVKVKASEPTVLEVTLKQSIKSTLKLTKEEVK